jgi:hypothetical protein
MTKNGVSDMMFADTFRPVHKPLVAAPYHLI